MPKETTENLIAHRDRPLTSRTDIDPRAVKDISGALTALLADHCYGSVDLAGHIVVRLELAGAVERGSFERYLGLLNA